MVITVVWHLPNAYRSHTTSFIAFSNLGIHHTPFYIPVRNAVHRCTIFTHELRRGSVRLKTNRPMLGPPIPPFGRPPAQVGPARAPLKGAQRTARSTPNPDNASRFLWWRAVCPFCFYVARRRDGGVLEDHRPSTKFMSIVSYDTSECVVVSVDTTCLFIVDEKTLHRLCNCLYTINTYLHSKYSIRIFRSTYGRRFP